MAKQRYINTHFWDDGYIRNLSATEKLMFLYLLTNSLTTIAGAYEVGLDRIEFDTKIPKDDAAKILKKFEADKKVAYRDGWVFIANFIKNQCLSEKVLIGITEAAKRCPDWIKDSIYIRYQDLYIGFDILNLKSNIKHKRKRSSFDSRVVEIFEEWKTVLTKKSSLDAKRHTLLAAALKSFSVADLKLVPHGALRSPWHTGQNPNKKKYLEISTLFRDNEQIEKFIDLAKEPNVSVTVTNAGPSAREINRMAREAEAAGGVH